MGRVRTSLVTALALLSLTGGAAAEGPAPDAPRPVERRTYTVRKGDSVSRIARRLGVSPELLRWWNPVLSNPRRLRPGRELIYLVPAEPRPPAEAKTSRTPKRDEAPEAPEAPEARAERPLAKAKPKPSEAKAKAKAQAAQAPAKATPETSAAERRAAKRDLGKALAAEHHGTKARAAKAGVARAQPEQETAEAAKAASEKVESPKAAPPKVESPEAAPPKVESPKAAPPKVEPAKVEAAPAGRAMRRAAETEEPAADGPTRDEPLTPAQAPEGHDPPPMPPQALPGRTARGMPRRSPLPDFGLAPGQKPLATSIGNPNRGRLVGGVALPKRGPGYRRINKQIWGTDQTIALIQHAGQRLAARFPGTKPLLVGAISEEGGGHCRGHASHQNGLDVDIAYLEQGNPKRSHYKARVQTEEIDWEKMWFVFETWVLTGKLNYVFVDHTHLPHLRREAKRSGWLGAQLEQLFGDEQFRGPDRVFRHWPGHTYHAHVRFVCPVGDTQCEHSRY